MVKEKMANGMTARDAMKSVMDEDKRLLQTDKRSFFEGARAMVSDSYLAELSLLEYVLTEDIIELFYLASDTATDFRKRAEYLHKAARYMDTNKELDAIKAIELLSELTWVFSIEFEITVNAPDTCAVAVESVDKKKWGRNRKKESVWKRPRMPWQFHVHYALFIVTVLMALGMVVLFFVLAIKKAEWYYLLSIAAGETGLLGVLTKGILPMLATSYDSGIKAVTIPYMIKTLKQNGYGEYDCAKFDL